MMPSFAGLSVALATPFRPDGGIDLPAFRGLVRHVVAGGADVLVALGTTGEAPSLTDLERDSLVSACLEEASGRPVVVGTGSNATRHAVAWTRRAQELGAQGALVVTPYYNKPTPKGLLAHYEAVAESAPGLPLIAYNVPGRTGQNLAPSTLARLWDNPQVVALKESSGNLAQMGEIVRTLPAGKLLLAGDDNLALPALALGAHGLVSVLANVMPEATKALVEACLRGDLAEARAWHVRLLPLMDALFAESNPVPVKAALALLGLCGSAPRLPLAPAEPATVARLSAALALAMDGSVG